MKRLALVFVIVTLAAGTALLATPKAATAGFTHPEIAAMPNTQDGLEFMGGRSGCRKCHIKIYRSWEGTPHATALEKLPAEDQGRPECVKCHVTGLGQPGGFATMEETPDLAGVGCESCHGAGSAYMDRDTMKDRDASVAAGLKIPDEQTCLGCHNDESPQFEGFDYETYKAEGVHEIE